MAEINIGIWYFINFIDKSVGSSWMGNPKFDINYVIFTVSVFNSLIRVNF
jgi:hypothetical protein